MGIIKSIKRTISIKSNEVKRRTSCNSLCFPLCFNLCFKCKNAPTSSRMRTTSISATDKKGKTSVARTKGLKSSKED